MFGVAETDVVRFDKISPHITRHVANARISLTRAWFLSEAEIQV
jgi:hypothetical protein